MPHPLYLHLSKYVVVSESEFSDILNFFEKRKLSKKEIIMQAGTKCNSNYFVAQGCLHMYLVNENGNEQTVQFGIENWWITDFMAFQHQKTTDYFIQAVENSEILCIDSKKQEELFKKFPQVESYFRIIYQTAYGAAINRLKYIFTYSKEVIYYKFREQFPDFVARVPQYLVATYLGLTPEYLSQIKHKQQS
ncbi:Crp/Fnr family transcriptional regulator [Algoriphagus sp.]|uniref:Crp/Fnr family transcriptional regulator n=1 Tax=Algoriphagus sp. TaxID=1872435 RepID=UPI0025FE70A0|nr:Crp/Fnr family transcriptional regulator [Algoriphagus sp.]